MTNNVVLNNVSHNDLKVIAKFDEKFGENIGSALVFPSEFIELQKEYTILFQLNSKTKKYRAIALLGLEQNENLFLDKRIPSGWDAHYVPAIIKKGPFLIGAQNAEHHGEEQKSFVVHVDLDHRKVSRQEGYALFLEHGGNSPYLEHITSVLSKLHLGVALLDPMFKLFSELDLIKPIKLEIEMNNGTEYKLIGNYTIDENKMTSLNGEQLVKLNKSGFLHLAYAVINSISNIRKLTEIKNSKTV